ncbi:MAG: penicillin-binding protein 2 [Stagnimonas sp.]|nr:penicillin-binding protein 2 [Stagnimonas sp.]
MNSYDALKDLYEEKRNFSGRILVAGVLLILMVLLLLARLADLQVLQHDYFSTRANDNRMRVVPMPPVRGLIYDRNGTLLAQNRPSFNLEVTREQVEDMDALLEQLTPVMGLTPGDIARFKDRVRKTPRYRGVPLRTNLNPEEVARFEINRYNFKGVDITAGLSRTYAMGPSASHVMGYVGGISEADYAKLDERLYQGINQIGKLGIERSHEDELRGTPGARIVEANASGRPLRELEQRPGAPGRNLYLSLDAKLQNIAELALGELDGAVAAIDPQTGEVLALVSKPGFDPHPFVEGISTKNYRALQSDPSRPLYNRALQGTYPPGSTIKPFMTFAGLFHGETSNEQHVNCSGTYYLPNSSRKFRCHKRTGHGTLDMGWALAKSCDIFYYQLATNLGIDRISEVMGQFGFGKPTGIDIPHERSGLSPSREWKRRVRKEPWFPGETLNIGIGQGYWQVTPLQLAQATARLAMRGGGFEPHLVHAIEDPLTGTVTGVTPKALPPMLESEPHEYDDVITAMELVTHTPGGTAYRIGRDSPYRIAGKTGTAQVAGLSQAEEDAPELSATPKHLRDHAWFLAFAPTDKPRIAIAVLVEHAGHGGSVAAPVARQVMDQYLLGRVQFATATLAATAAPAANASADPGAAAGEFDGFVTASERPAPPPLPAVPTLTIPAQKPPGASTENPADAVEVDDAEAAFEKPPAAPAPVNDAADAPPPEGELNPPKPQP